MISYRIFNDGEYAIEAKTTPTGALAFNLAKAPSNRRWVWCDVRIDGEIIVRYADNQHILSDPEAFAAELDQAIAQKEDMEEAVDNANTVNDEHRPATFALTMSLANEAFHDGSMSTDSVLEDVARRISRGEHTGVIIDTNGNRVGDYTQTYEAGLDRDLA